MRPLGLQLFILLIISFSVFGQIQNRSFELAVPIEPNTLPFTPPLHWEFINYAGIHSVFHPSINYNQTAVKWWIPNPVEGEKFLVLSTGDMGPESDGRIASSRAYQDVFLPAGTNVTGSFFFGTCDYRPFTDNASIELIPIFDPNNPPPYLPQTISLASCSVDIVGDYGSTGTWKSFSYSIEPEEEGLYSLVMEIRDGGADTIYESYLAIDNLMICGPGVLVGDLNKDCLINLDDLSLFSREWLCICDTHPWDPNDPSDPNDPNDPNTIVPDPNSLPFYFVGSYPSNPSNSSDPNNPSDPNSLCIYADFNRNYMVEPNDLVPLMGNWLKTDF